MEEKGTVKEKSRIFAIDIIKLYKRLTESKKEYVLSKQLLRCGTSIGANVAEAGSGISKKDFLSDVFCDTIPMSIRFAPFIFCR